MIDLDVTRAVALIGVVVMNYHGYLILRGGPIGDVGDQPGLRPVDGPAVDPLRGDVRDGRRHGHHVDDQPRPAQRRPLATQPRSLDAAPPRASCSTRSGSSFEWIWNGTILFFYGAFFMVGALLFTLRIRWLVADRRPSRRLRQRRCSGGRSKPDSDTSWLFEGWYTPGAYRSPRRLLFDTFVNGTHPLLPWLAFLCAGMVLGRYLPLRSTSRWVLAAFGVVLVAGTYLANDLVRRHAVARRLLATDPFSRSLNYTVCALGSSIAAFCVIGWIANATRIDAGDAGARRGRAHDPDPLHPARVGVQRRSSRGGT